MFLKVLLVCLFLSISKGGNLRGVEAIVLNYDIIVSVFELQSRYYELSNLYPCER